MSTPTMSHRLAKNTFKINMCLEGSEPVAVPVSLFDLLAYDDPNDSNEPIKFRYKGLAYRDDYKGLKLQHDIIVYDPTLYDADGRVDQDSAIFRTENWEWHGMDLGVVEYDKRSKPYFKKIEANGVHPIPGSPTLNPSNNTFKNINPNNPTSGETGWVIYPKEAMLYPKDFTWFHKNDGTTQQNNRFGKPWYTDQAKFMGFDTNLTISVVGEKETQILLGDPDLHFNSVLVSGNNAGGDLKGYTTIAFSSTDENIWKYVSYIIGHEGYFGSPGMIFDARNAADAMFWPNIELFRNTYIWVRCSFFGDYIKYQDFNQLLNENGDVLQRNLTLGEDIDRNKFDGTSHSKNQSTSGVADTSKSTVIPSEEFNPTFDINYQENLKKDRSEFSEAYLPQTAPSIDLLKDKVLPDQNSVFADDFPEQPINNILNPLLQMTEKPYEAKFEGLTTVINRNKASGSVSESTHKQNLGIPGWFEPESRLPFIDPVTQRQNFTDKPVVFPKAGNLRIKGRVLSPTVDELWAFIKASVFGREADLTNGNIEVKPSFGKILATETEEQTDQNTYPFPSRKDTFLYKDRAIYKKGDSLKYKRLDNEESTALNEETFVSTFFVNNPNAIKYQIFEIINDTFTKMGLNSSVDLRDSVLPYDIGDNGNIKVKRSTSGDNQLNPKQDLVINTQNDVIKQNQGFQYNPKLRETDTAQGSFEDYPANLAAGVYGSQNIEFTSEFKPIEKRKNGLRVLIGDSIKNASKSAWASREKPFSIKELELWVKMNRYNLISLSEALYLTTPVTGSWGKRDWVENGLVNNKTPTGNETPAEEAQRRYEINKNKTRGSLYLFHWKFDNNFANPNSLLDVSRVVYDPTYQVWDPSLVTLTDPKTNIYTGDAKTDYLNHHESNEWPDSSHEFSSAEIYMSGDGTWRRVSDQFRFPVYNETY